MKVICKKLPSRRKKCVATIGVFDGIHLGHQYILAKTKQEAKKSRLASLVITFDILPQQFLHKNITPSGRKSRKDFLGYISNFSQKTDFIRKLDIDYLWFLRTNHRLLELSPKEFIDHIYKYFEIKKLIVGQDFHFGFEGKGDLAFLRKVSREYGFKLVVARKESKDGKIISSSIIRYLIKDGKLLEARKFLGRNFSMRGQVHKGKRLGTKLDFPTANIHTHDYVIPPCGVYAAYVVLGRRSYLAAVNIGFRPTIAKTKKTILEAHVINFKKDILGKTIEVIFLEKIRNEHKFESIERLKLAIAKDIDQVTSKYSIYPPQSPQLIVA